MAKLNWKSREYNGVTSSYAQFTAELKAISSSAKENTNGSLFRNATVEFEGESLRGIMPEKNYAHCVNIGDKLLCEVSTTDGTNFITTVSHLTGGSSVDAAMATSIFGFGGLMEAALEVVEDSRD